MSFNMGLAFRFALPITVWLVVYWSSLSTMVGVWANSKTYEHSYLIVPISLWLVWQKKEQIKSGVLDTAFLPIILLVLPSLLWIVGRLADVSFFEHIAAITSLQLIIWAVIGNQLTKLLFFPIFYLVFCIPFGEELIPYLQEVTASLSVILVRLSGVPVFREGMYLTIPTGKFEVAEACSGIRFLISSIALGTLFANFFFTKKWKLFLYIAFSCSFPILANSIRAYGIIMIGYWSDMKYATGADHLIYGWVFFAMVIGMMFYIGWKFQDYKVHSKDTVTSSTTANKITSSSIIPPVLITIILLSSNTWLKIIHNDKELGNSSSESQVYSPNLSNWEITLPQADQVLIESNIDHTITIFNAIYLNKKSRSDLINSKNSIYNKEIWTIDKSYKFSINGKNATGITLVNSRGESKKIIYWQCINEFCSNNQLKLKFVKAYYLFTNQAINSSVTAVSSGNLEFPVLEKNFINYVSNEKGRLGNER